MADLANPPKLSFLDVVDAALVPHPGPLYSARESILQLLCGLLTAALFSGKLPLQEGERRPHPGK